MKLGNRCFLFVLAASIAMLFSNAGAIVVTGKANVTVAKEQAGARKIDEYGKIAPADENARLDNFAIALSTDAKVQGYLIAYGGRRSQTGDAKKAAARAKTYLVKKRQFQAERLVTVDGG